MRLGRRRRRRALVRVPGSGGLLIAARTARRTAACALALGLLLALPGPGLHAQSPERIAELERQLRKALEADDQERALELLREQLREQELASGPSSREVAQVLVALIDVHGVRGDYLDVKRYAARIVRMAEVGVKLDHSVLSRVAAKLALIYADQGLDPSKQSLFERALVPVLLAPRPGDHVLASALLQAGNILYARGETPEALTLYRAGIKVGLPSLDSNQENMALLYNNAGSALLQTGERDAAKQAFEVAVRIRESTGQQAKDPEYAHVLVNVAAVYAMETRLESAEYVLDVARKVYRGADAWERPGVRKLLELQTQVYLAQERFDAAERSQRELIAWLEKDLGNSHRETVQARTRHHEIALEARSRAREGR